MATDQPTVAFVWVWLPGERTPVVAGRLDDEGAITTFAYGRSYLGREAAVALFEPELPLLPGRQEPEFLRIHGCIADAGPDTWGRRVINRRRFGTSASNTDLTEVTYLLESGSDRIGALDFQSSPEEYRPREDTTMRLEDLLAAAEAVDEGRSLPPWLDLALLHGTSVGGARPKATLIDGETHRIAKFSSKGDLLPNVKLEYIAMTLARRSGLDVAPVDLVSVLGKDVLLVERFDRPAGGTRRAVVSARTMLRLGEMGIGASYSDLADLVRKRFSEPEETVHELFARITFNILVGNTDDHARNHAAFWNGSTLALTPAYDIVPQQRTGEEANQAMSIGPDGFAGSQLAGCVEHSGTYLLSESEARGIIDRQISVLEQDWITVCEQAGLGEAERYQVWGRQFLNPYALLGY